MTCVDIQNRLAAFLDGQLPAEETTVMKIHLAACAGCAAQIESMRRVLAFVDRWNPPAPAADLRSALREKVRAPTISMTGRKPLPLFGKLLRYAAAVIVGIPLGLFVLGLVESANPEPAATAAQDESLAPLLVAEFDELHSDSLGGAYDQLIADGR